MANKTQLVDALSEKLGDRRIAAEAVDTLFDFIIREVDKGQRVTITGFGSFEPRERAARTARNPRTGDVVQVPKTTVPAFRAGTLFRDVVAGSRELPKAAPARRTTATRTTAASTTTRRPAAAKAAVPAPAEAAPAKPAKKSKKAAKAVKPAKAAPKAPKKAEAKTGPKASGKKAKKNQKSAGKKKK